MADILVVTAPNRFNLGMYSVDRAAVAFFAEMGAGTGLSVAFRTVREHSQRGHGYGDLPIDEIDPARDFRAGDFRAGATVFWGDFTTAPSYGFDNFRAVLSRRHVFWRTAGLRMPRRWSFRRWMALFSPPSLSASSLSASSHSAPCHSFGQNFQIAQGLERAQTGPQMERLFRATGFDPERHLAGFATILARDSVSQARVNALRGEAEAPRRESHVCDMAFLGRPPGPRRKDRTGRVGLFLARSRLSQGPVLAGLIAERHEVLDLSGWLAARPATIGADYRAHLDRIEACDLVVTDVYHLAINAILSGVPVLCLGTDDGAQRDALSDFKKKILFQDIGAAGAYLSLPGPDTPAPAIWQDLVRRMAGIGDLYGADFHDRLGDFIASSRRRMQARLGL